MSDSLVTPWTVARQAPLSMGFLSKNTGVGCPFLLQGIFPTRRSNPPLPHLQADSLPLRHQGSPFDGAPVCVLSCPTLGDLMDCTPPGSSAHGISQATMLAGWPFPTPGTLSNPGSGPVSPALAGGFYATMPAGSPSDGMLLLLLSRFSRVRLCATPQTAAHQAPPSLGFSRQEHWSELPFPSPVHENEK